MGQSKIWGFPWFQKKKYELFLIRYLGSTRRSNIMRINSEDIDLDDIIREKD